MAKTIREYQGIKKLIKKNYKQGKMQPLSIGLGMEKGSVSLDKKQ